VITDADISLLTDFVPDLSASGEVRIVVEDIEHRDGSRALVRKLSQGRPFSPTTTLWLDLTTQPVSDWRAFRRTWEAVVANLDEYLPRPAALGVSGSALLLPGNTAGHLSAEFLAALMPKWARQRWVGLPVDPACAEYYLASLHTIGLRSLRPLEAFSRLGFRIQGEISNAQWSRAEEAGLLDALPGHTKQQRLASFLALFPEVDRLRVQTQSGVHTLRRTTARSRVRRSTALSLPASRSRRPPASRGTRSSAVWLDSGTEGVFADLERIELLMVVSGHKAVMRTSVRPERWPRLRAFLDRHGLAWASQANTARYLLDRGKGGWSNLLDDTSGKRPGRQELFVYVAREQRLADQLLALEGSDDDAFGALLGYPQCCRLAFKRMFPVALRHQGDLIPVVADQTPGPQPWSFLLNIVGRYFGTALLSFYPCSFSCTVARGLASTAFAEIAQVAPNDASAIRSLLSAPCLYTEYQGIYAFPDATWDDGFLRYYDVLMTTRNRIGAALREGSHLNVAHDGRLEISNRGRSVGTIGGANVRLMVFAAEESGG
jgi:hypothetical protein